ncbi:MAG: molybdopterin-dependent oxidoreductase [Candidatus Bipolaricaulia bacterium]
MGIPHKHADMLVRQSHPYNAEPPLHLLQQHLITPIERFYVRNHGNIPEIDTETFRLSVSGLVEQELRLSLDELASEFPTATVTATLQCAGNRRDELMAVRDIPGDVPWAAQTISNAVWRGVALRDVLDAAGLRDDARHVAFLGLDEIDKDGQIIHFGGSVPIEKACQPSVLLALEMNGEPLPPEHGYPLRVVVPGYIGARSVKWLSQITVQSHPSTNHYQARSYKLFPPHVDADSADWEQGLMLGELSINSVIATPQQGETLSAGNAQLSGYAMAGGDRTVARVDVSPDGGQRWVEATLLDGEGSDSPWAWVFWEADVELTPGQHELVVRAWDSAANTQPESVAPLWNFKGYMNNAWHRVRVSVEG